MKAKSVLILTVVSLLGLLLAAGAPSSQSLPDRWHPSRARLVPLLMPSEVVSLGNFAMRPGGGGNCGREPIASIRRMRAGDALVTVQEYALSPKMHRRQSRIFPSGLPSLDPAALHGAATYAPPRGQSRRVRSETIHFLLGGRAFDALVYVAGPLDRALRAEIDAELGSLDLRRDG